MPRIKPQESSKRPGLSWSSGKEIVGHDRYHRGLFIDTGLDADLDTAAEAAGWQRGELTHMEGTREHWLLPAPTPLFVLIEGVPYTKMADMVKNDVAYAGIGARWPQGAKSALAVQVLHPDLLGQGYITPLTLTVSSTSTTDLLNALLDHDRVLTACEDAAAAKGNPRTFEFWEVAVSLTAGDKVQRGGALTTMISPIVSGHPATPTVPYLRGLLAPKYVADLADTHRDSIKAWAADFARPFQASGADEAPAPPPARPTPVPAAAPAPVEPPRTIWHRKAPAAPTLVPSKEARMPRIAMANERQVATLRGLAEDRDIDVREELQRIGPDVTELVMLTEDEAAQLSTAWQRRPKAQRAA